jgi:hypothetical protein
MQNNLGTRSDQDLATVWRLRLGIGALGILLPFVLIGGNWIFQLFGSKTVIVPASMSGSYYTSTRNIFVGGLCALGVFLVGYRRNRAEDVCSSIAGVAIVTVALFPTSPPAPATAPAWISYLHHSAAALFISILGVFCCVFFMDYRGTQSRPATPGEIRNRLLTAVKGDSPDSHHRRYLVCGVLIFAYVIIALVTGVTNWGSGMTLTPLYLCEGLSVLTFGFAWIDKALNDPHPSVNFMRYASTAAKRLPALWAPVRVPGRPRHTG